MDSLTFVAEIVKALAWPVTVLIILVVLRDPLRQLIPLLQRLRYGGVELDFGQRVQELAAEARQQLPASAATGPEIKPLRDRLDQLAQLSPRATVLEAWLELENAAIEATKRHGLNLTSREQRSPILLGDALERAGILDESKQEIYYRLRNLRNAAAHASDFAFDSSSAVEYADTALRLAEYLRKA